jgi:hypothetical protein
MMEGGSPPPQSTVMQMMMAAWAAQTIATVARLGVADVLHDQGPLTARELTERHRVDARPDLLERALRACASVGVFTEAADGRFGPTPLSGVLVDGAPGSIRQFVELIGGRWWTLFGGLGETVRTGELRKLPPDPDSGQTEKFGKAMKSRIESTRGAVEHSDLSRARMVVDVGGGFGHLAIALLERYPDLRACVLDLPETTPIHPRSVESIIEGIPT